jgi:hypothetical protein
MREISKTEFDNHSDLGKPTHPDHIMGGLIDLIRKIGTKKFLHGSGLNKERDSFVAVLFTYAIRKWSHREWYIQQIQDPPDFHIISPTDRPTKEKPIDRLGVEIVELKDETVEVAISTLERTKLTNYAPGEGTVLLIFINSKIGLVNLKDFSIWIARNQDKFKAFSEIYILFLSQFTPETALDYTLVNVLKVWSQHIVLKEEFNKGVLFPHPLIDKFGVKVKSV